MVKFDLLKDLDETHDGADECTRLFDGQLKEHEEKANDNPKLLAKLTSKRRGEKNTRESELKLGKPSRIQWIEDPKAYLKSGEDNCYNVR